MLCIPLRIKTQASIMPLIEYMLQRPYGSENSTSPKTLRRIRISFTQAHQKIQLRRLENATPTPDIKREREDEQSDNRVRIIQDVSYAQKLEKISADSPSWKLRFQPGWKNPLCFNSSGATLRRHNSTLPLIRIPSNKTQFFSQAHLQAKMITKYVTHQKNDERETPIEMEEQEKTNLNDGKIKIQPNVIPHHTNHFRS